MLVSNSICVITGINGAAATSIGERLRDEGARVIGTIRPKSENSLLEERGDGSHQIGLDPLDPLSIKTAIETIIAQFGVIHVWVNVVGGFDMGDQVEQTIPSRWEDMLDMNFRTALNCSQAILPHFREQTRGRLINFGSATVADGMPLAGPYLVSKSAVHTLTRICALELPGDITCNAILPTIIDTEKNRQAMPDADQGSWVSPQRIATEILRFIEGSGNGELIVL